MGRYGVRLGDIARYGYDVNTALQSYDCPSEEERARRNNIIYRHYKYFEISPETVDMFLDQLETDMIVNAAYINAMYSSVITDFKAANNIEDETITTLTNSISSSMSEASSKGEQSSLSASKGTGKNKGYALPTPGVMQGDDYASSLAESETDSSSDSSGKATGEQSGKSSNNATADGTVTRHREALVGMTEAEAARRFRNALINADEIMLATIRPLFSYVFETDFQIY
jgi:hypothetical protein